jgi:hypothetical protein
MLHDDCSPGAPTSADEDVISLKVPPCVQQFSTRRPMLARLRAIARRRSRGAAEPEPPPLQLQVAENPHWPAEDLQQLAGLGTGPREWFVDRAEAAGMRAGLTSEEPSGSAPGSLRSAAGVLDIDPKPASAPDPSAAIIRQLTEDNQDLKAALCQLIRIAEQHHAAVRLLEHDNAELSALVHRLTIGQTTATPAPTPSVRRRRWRMPGWSVQWLRRRQARRCT